MSPASYQTAPPRDDLLGGPPRVADLQTRAGNGTRTRDPDLGKVVLYQLSYSRNCRWQTYRALPDGATFPSASGGEGDRTPDLVNAIHALSQLSYAPAIIRPLEDSPRESEILAL